MKKTIILLTIILLTMSASAQSWQWANRMGSVFQSGTFGDNEQVAGVGTDNAGNIYIAGKVMGFPTFGVTSFTSHGQYYQGFLAKYDCSGSLIWVQLLLNNQGGDKVTGLAVDGAGNCYLNGFAAGDTTYFGNTQYTFGNSPGWFIAKYDSSGAVQWHIFTQTSPSALTEGGPVIGINSQGNIIAAGWNDYPGTIFSGINLRKGNFIAAFNPVTGNCLWGTNIDTVAVNSNARYLQILSMKLGTDDDIYFTGWIHGNVQVGNYTLSGGINQHGFILKYNSNGNLIWAKQDYGASAATTLFSLALTNNSIFVIGTAWRNDTIFNYRITFAGSQIQTNFILKLDTSANLIWGIPEDSVNGVYSGPFPALTVDNNGNLFCTSGFGSRLKWGTIYPSISSNPSNGVNPYLLKLNSSGQVSSLMNIPSYSTSGNPFDGGEGISINSLGDVYVGGAFSQKLWTTAGDTVYNSGGNVDLFLVKYGAICSNVGIDESPMVEKQKETEGINLIAYPNPNNGQFDIIINSSFQISGMLVLINSIGQEVAKESVNITNGSSKLSVNLLNLPSGIYDIELQTEKEVVHKKVSIVR